MYNIFYNFYPYPFISENNSISSCSEKGASLSAASTAITATASSLEMAAAISCGAISSSGARHESVIDPEKFLNDR